MTRNETREDAAEIRRLAKEIAHTALNLDSVDRDRLAGIIGKAAKIEMACGAKVDDVFPRAAAIGAAR